jgi:hypothetical protein
MPQKTSNNIRDHDSKGLVIAPAIVGGYCGLRRAVRQLFSNTGISPNVHKTFTKGGDNHRT